MATVYLALGSNLGERLNNLSTALQRLREIVTLHNISSVYETEPVGYLDQPRFLNIVCSGETSLNPLALLHAAKAIEAQLGRQPTFRNAPRPIDIDILLYDDLRLTQTELIIPHPRMAERAFVLVPLAEIAPDVIDPASGQSALALAQSIPHTGVTRIKATLATLPEQ